MTVVASATMNQDERDGPRIPAGLTTMARKSLQRWATVNAQRDELVRLAAKNGVGINEISRITGLAKTTVIRITRSTGD
jgi:DNA invertase Pin-like site-specific DNA recombinase